MSVSRAKVIISKSDILVDRKLKVGKGLKQSKMSKYMRGFRQANMPLSRSGANLENIISCQVGKDFNTGGKPEGIKVSEVSEMSTVGNQNDMSQQNILMEGKMI